jgi:hypothetical protein
MAKHNKKRNVGLLHEQLVRHASEMTVEGNQAKATEAIDILMKHFQEGTEMIKEFRLFSSLIHTQVSSSDIARRIIEESKKACSNHRPTNLMKEKSALIKDINHVLDRKDFYNQRVKDYKIFSTVQALLYEWRGRSSLAPDERIQYELVLERHLTRSDDKETLDKIENADPLVLNIMIEKFNEKYEGVLSTHQKKLLEAKLSGNDEEVILLSAQIKEKVSSAVEAYFYNCDSKFLSRKKDRLEENIANYKPSKTDESIAKALSLSNLLKELEE